MTNEDLTRIYNEANGIPEGKAPPITTERIFTAMRAAMEHQRLLGLASERAALGALLREDVVEMRFKIQDACRAYDARLAP